MNAAWVRIVFWISAVYDGVLGVAFLFAGESIFSYFEVTPPNHLGYVHFPALLLIIFAIMFARIAMDPGGNRQLMLYGLGLKISYSTVVFYHHATGGVPPMWLPFAYADLVFAIAYIVAWTVTQGPGDRGD